MKPEKPITRKEMYLDVATGGSTELPSPVTREEKYLAKIAGESVDIPTPVTRYEMLLAAVAGESYTPTPVTRLEIYLAKAAGQDVETPQPVTREEMYWFDYCGGTPTPPEREYTGAVPVTFTADGTPLLDYIISGNTVQSGTPTPDNPIMPQGTGERTGNLFDKAWFNNNTQLSSTTGLPIEYVGRIAIVNPIDVSNIDAVTLTYSLGTTVVENFMYSIFSGNTLIERVAGKKSGDVIDVTNADTLYICLYIGDRNITVNDVQWIMLNSGSTALPYEPYGYKIPISSANTTTPIYLGEVQTTRKIRKLVLTGEETLTSGSVIGQIRTPLTGAIDSLGLCTHYILKTSYGGAFPYIRIRSNTLWFEISPDGYETKEEALTDFKSYLAAQYAAGTPVTVWYVLANETTAVVNEPLMRIGDYADTLSMEQAGVSIPTVNGSTTLDVETTVKPSEVYIKYRGEAVATLSALPAEVSSTEATTEEENPEETEETENGSEDVSL